MYMFECFLITVSLLSVIMLFIGRLHCLPICGKTQYYYDRILQIIQFNLFFLLRIGSTQCLPVYFPNVFAESKQSALPCETMKNITAMAGLPLFSRFYITDIAVIFESVPRHQLSTLLHSSNISLLSCPST